MKIWKRLFCLLLSLVLIFSMVSTAFAQTSKQSPNKPNYEFYVPMGTSITGGYRLPGDGTGGTVGKPDGVFSNEYTYAYLVGEEFDIPNHYSGAILGSRALEYRMLLEEDFPEENVDNYNNIWVGPRCGNDYDHLHNELGPVYKEALANADIISVEIGLNDVTSYAMCTLMTELEDKVKESGEEDLFAYLESIGGEGVAPSSEEMLGILAIADYLGAYEDIFTELTNLFMEGLENYSTDFPIVLQDIRKINPNADLFVVGCYNPLGYMLDHEITANENGNIDIKNLILSTGETLSLDAEQTTWLFNLMEEYIVGSQNLIIQNACRSNNATFVDIRGIDLSGSADGTHPYIAGHAFIADHLSDAIYGLYPCQHRHLTTYNAVTPTIISLGYTGNTYCVDCGALISTGRVITYSEYQRQQNTGNVPSAEEVRGETVDPFDDPTDEAVTSELAGKSFVIAYRNRALGVSANKGYTGTTKTTNSWGGETTTTVTTSGLEGKTLQLDGSKMIKTDLLTNDILWTFESAGSNKYRIKNNATGQYLGGTSASSSGWGAPSTLTEDLFLTDSTSYTWSYNGSALTYQSGSGSRATTLYLSFDTPETTPAGYKGSTYLFTAHKSQNEGNVIKLYAATSATDEPIVDDEKLLEEAKKLLGKCIEWKQSGIGEGTFCLVVNDYAIGLDAGKGIAVQQVSNASQVKNLGKRFQWKIEKTDTGYSFENVGNAGYYLGAYTESTILTTKASLSVSTAPYSWQFSNNRLSTSVKARGFLNVSFSNTYYLSCTNGALSLSTGSVSNTVKLYQSVKSAANHANLVRTNVPVTCTTDGTATFTCSECGATITIVTAKAHGHADTEPQDGRCDHCGTLIEEETPPTPTTQTYKFTVDGVNKGSFEAGTGVSATAGTKDGYEFAGWKAYRSSNNRNELSESALGLSAGAFANNTINFNMPANTVYLVSQWNETAAHHTVKVDNSKAIEYVVGTDVTVDAGTKGGYTFQNWTVKDGEGTDLTETDLGLTAGDFAKTSFTFKMPAKDLVFTTVWEKDATYYVQVNNQKTYYAAGATVEEIIPGTRENYVFDHWTVKDDKGADLTVDGLVVTANPLSFTMPEANVVLTPNYERDGIHFTVKVGNQTTYYEKGTPVTVSAGTKSGSVFKGWTAKDTTGTDVDLGIDLTTNSITFNMPEKDIVLTANWAAQHKVTVDGKTSYHLTGETVTINAGTKTNARFTGWIVTAANKGKTPDDLDVTKADATFTMPDNDLTITSSWEKTTHTVKFVTNGGTSYDSLEVVDGYVLNLNSYRPTKSGYTFQRWNLDADLTRSAGNSVTVTDDITLYASYTSNGFFGTGENGFSSAAGNLFSGISSFFNSFFRW